VWCGKKLFLNNFGLYNTKIRKIDVEGCEFQVLEGFEG
jgi:hypothetical protein